MTNWPDPRSGATGPRRLVLVRHAKAVKDSRSGDRARPLTDRGRADAATAGGWMDWRLQHIDAIWSSSATRARETTEEIRGKLTAPPEATYRDDLYDAGPAELLAAVRASDGDILTLVLVGHNPATEQLHELLTGDGRGFPTCAVAVLEADGEWGRLGSGSARTVDFFTP
jgi:phosphohistidine phosphatase